MHGLLDFLGNVDPQKPDTDCLNPTEPLLTLHEECLKLKCTCGLPGPFSGFRVYPEASAPFRAIATAGPSRDGGKVGPKNPEIFAERMLCVMTP